MPDTTNTSADLRERDQHWQQYDSLPGQRELFAEWEHNASAQDPSYSCGRCELFDTGKDLPGAAERDQAIFWDVA